MAQCQGTTKSGTRCKRDANEGGDYCGFHEDQAEAPNAEGASSDGSADRSTDLILVGAVAVALFALRRVLRLF